MTRRNVFDPAVTAAAIVTLAGCGSPPAEQGRRPAPSSDEGKPLAPTRAGYADVGGARFYYQIHGALDSGKTPLLVLHGSFMSGDAMAPFVTRFATTRPVIALDARGHGRTGDLPGPLTYEQMADDAAGVLDALEVKRADVLGYSMGANTAIVMAVRHPDKVGKQVIVSGTSRRDGWYPEVLQALEHIKAEDFAGSPLEKEYKRLSPTPDAFPTLVAENRALDASDYDSSNEAIRGIEGKTMIVVGDTDAVALEHAVELFKLRGGGDRKVATQGFMTEAPPARLAVLPGTAHVGIMANAQLIADLAVPFLDDVKPTTPPGFFSETP